MIDDQGRTHLTEEEASGGEKGTGMRYVLMVSLALIVIVLSVIWLVPALTGGEI